MKFGKQFLNYAAAALVVTVGSVTIRVHAEPQAQQSQAAPKAAARKEAAGVEAEGFTLSLKAKKSTYTVAEAVELDVLF